MKRLLNAFGLGFLCGMVLMLLISESFAVHVQITSARQRQPAHVTIGTSPNR